MSLRTHYFLDRDHRMSRHLYKQKFTPRMSISCLVQPNSASSPVYTDCLISCHVPLFVGRICTVHLQCHKGYISLLLHLAVGLSFRKGRLLAQINLLDWKFYEAGVQIFVKGSVQRHSSPAFLFSCIFSAFHRLLAPIAFSLRP